MAARGRGRGRGGRGRGRGRGKASTSSGTSRGRSKKAQVNKDEVEEEKVDQVEGALSDVTITEPPGNDTEVESSLKKIAKTSRSKRGSNASQKSLDLKTTAEQDQSNTEPAEPVDVKASKSVMDLAIEIMNPYYSSYYNQDKWCNKLDWKQEALSIGTRVFSPNIHMCVICRLPIHIYGRLLPCKHLYCYTCGLKQNRCHLCFEKVQRCERAPLGAVFMCSYGSFKYGFDGCRRTYLSQRDLEAHIDHRHKPRDPNQPSTEDVPSSTFQHVQQSSQSNSRGHQSLTHQRSNLIPVQIQSQPVTRPGNTSSPDTSSSVRPGTATEAYYNSCMSSSTFRHPYLHDYGF